MGQYFSTDKFSWVPIGVFSADNENGDEIVISFPYTRTNKTKIWKKKQDEEGFQPVKKRKTNKNNQENTNQSGGEEPRDHNPPPNKKRVFLLKLLYIPT